MYVTFARFTRRFLLPRPSSSRISCRSWTHPSPRVILPLRSITVTESTWRVVAFMLTVRSSLIGLNAGIQFLHHDDFGADAGQLFHLEFVHKGPNQEYPAPGHFQQILGGQGISNLVGIKSRTLVANMNHQPVVMYLKSQVDIFRFVVLVAVINRIDQRFVHGHFDLLPLVLIKPCRG